MTIALHINDNNLSLQNVVENGGNIVLQSRGYAWLDETEVLFDISGKKNPYLHCRLAPQQINNRYWQQCAETAIGSNQAGMRNAADLIWKHLTELKQRHNFEELALVVPANYRDSHLQLLLGIANAVNIDVVSVLSKPVVACASQCDSIEGDQIGREMFHLDVQLHQAVLAKIVLEEEGSNDRLETVKLVDTNIYSELSLQGLQESLLSTIQKTFIRDGRFDPLHDANTEQQVFDQLDKMVLNAIENGKATVGVQHNGQLYSAVIQLDEVEQAMSKLTGLVGSLSGQLMIDLNGAFALDNLPSLKNIVSFWANSTPTALRRNQAEAHSGGLVYQSSLVRTRATSQSTSIARQNASQPELEESSNSRNSTPKMAEENSAIATHLLQYGEAIAIEQARVQINHQGLTIESSNEDGNVAALIESGKLSIINADGRTTLAPNDKLVSEFADGVISVIRVV